jgi:hypothetical protein
MPSDIDCYTKFSIKYLNIDYDSEAKRASNLMKQDFEEKETPILFTKHAKTHMKHIELLRNT